eukprot:9229814-Pyramimonas_sp.AAC.1
MLHTTLSGGRASGIQTVGGAPLDKVPPVVGRGPATVEQRGAIAVTSQDALVRWRLYSEFTLRGVR